MDSAAGEDVGAKFEAGWQVFSRTCSGSVAPEATYQAWFAHYLISQFGIDRVAREPDFGHHTFRSDLRSHFGGHSVMVDLVITREPGIWMPRRSHRPDPDNSGASLLDDLAVISELKVASTQGLGLDHTSVAKDVWKLSMLLEEAGHREMHVPLAFACILDNNIEHPYNRSHLDKVLKKKPGHRGVVVLYHSITGGVSG